MQAADSVPFRRRDCAPRLGHSSLAVALAHLARLDHPGGNFGPGGTQGHPARGGGVGAP